MLTFGRRWLGSRGQARRITGGEAHDSTEAQALIKDFPCGDGKFNATNRTELVGRL
ncbi:hypothetical protein CZ787_14340 [Halomonas citrativorans]|uniref:Uncharacterized protein n=1 Tax=Halomonas citrativorans TaxID=2742612 RepID=A0A1R4I340_9GAMM|nr:hypothetical protein CZ787_14340 [Halomonas citrativorans]